MAKAKKIGGHLAEWTDEKALKKYYKKLDTEEVVAWVEALGAEFKPCDDEAIFRMRACMAVLYHFFPKQTKAKKESPYKKYSLEDLVQMAVDNSVPVETTNDERILRMRIIMSLRAHGVLAKAE